MGLFDFLSSGSVSVPGYKTIGNERGFDNEQLLALLSGVETPFGEPKMGWIRAFGKERQVIVYNRTDVINYTYVDAQRSKIVIATAPKPGEMGGSQQAEEEEYVDEDECANVDAVDALAEVIERLQDGDDASSFKVEDVAVEDEDEPICFYMEEPTALSLKKRFSIYDENDAEAYSIESNAVRSDYRIVGRDGRLVMEVRQKLGIVPEYLLLEDDEEIRRFKRKVSIIDVEFNGTLRGRTLKIEASLSGMDFTMDLDDERIGSVGTSEISRKFGGGGVVSGYAIEVYDAEMADEVVSIAALCAVLIQAAYQEQQNNNRNH